MTTTFFKDCVTINASGEVFKSEDGENFFPLFSGGFCEDKALCLTNDFENFYFYSGDGNIQVVGCKLN